MEVATVQKRLMEAHARIGFTGRFSFTINQSGDGKVGCYITHWFRPTPFAFEDCKTVGTGSIEECLDVLDDYVAAFNMERQPTDEELAATLGIAPVVVSDMVSQAAE